MRISIIIDAILFAIGILFSFLADALIGLPAQSVLEISAANFGAVLLVIISAALMGIGAGLILHWIIGFSKKITASIASLLLCGTALFIGIGASIGFIALSGWTALQAFVTFITLSCVLFISSFVLFFSGFYRGIETLRKRAGMFWQKNKNSKNK